MTHGKNKLNRQDAKDAKENQTKLDREQPEFFVLTTNWILK
jgi:hypothetical protein